jgi:hypothetical protein
MRQIKDFRNAVEKDTGAGLPDTDTLVRRAALYRAGA